MKLGHSILHICLLVCDAKKVSCTSYTYVVWAGLFSMWKVGLWVLPLDPGYYRIEGSTYMYISWKKPNTCNLIYRLSIVIGFYFLPYIAILHILSCTCTCSTSPGYLAFQHGFSHSPSLSYMYCSLLILTWCSVLYQLCVWFVCKLNHVDKECSFRKYFVSEEKKHIRGWSYSK